ncbi:hypothetical protein PT2222_130255 [Paraburkholderia tropica]
MFNIRFNVRKNPVYKFCRFVITKPFRQLNRFVHGDIYRNVFGICHFVCCQTQNSTVNIGNPVKLPIHQMFRNHFIQLNLVFKYTVYKLFKERICLFFI